MNLNIRKQRTIPKRWETSEARPRTGGSPGHGTGVRAGPAAAWLRTGAQSLGRPRWPEAPGQRTGEERAAGQPQTSGQCVRGRRPAEAKENRPER